MFPDARLQSYGTFVPLGPRAMLCNRQFLFELLLDHEPAVWRSADWQSAL